MSFKRIVISIQFVIALFMLGTLLFFATRLDFNLRDDKEPAAIFFLLLGVIYAIIYARFCWLYYKTAASTFMAISLIMGIAYVLFWVKMLTQ
ncbi:MAG: hypothetical protein U0V74_06210 [Chitinophagales bacterium]